MIPKIGDKQRIVSVPDRNWKLDKTKVYGQENYLKPSGLWYSLGLSWIDWCAAEDFIDEGYLFELFIDEEKLLKLKTAKDVYKFTDKYFKTLVPIKTKHKYLASFIDWKQVKKEHPYGIEIAPYNWECRFELIWYNGWDCASGCIWDLNIIKGVKYFDKWSVRGN